MPSREPDDVFRILVSELAYTVMPSVVICLTIAVIGLFAYDSIGNIQILLAVGSGVSISISKIFVMRAHKRFNATRQATIDEAVRWELIHALHTFIAAASICWLGSLMFIYHDLSVQILATALLYGYCAGVASRVSVRPYIAASAIVIASVPPTIVVALQGDTAHLILATIFAVFIGAAMQSVWHVYRMATRQISLRLEIEQQARRDPLTGLCNRIALTEAFQALKRDEDTLTCVHCFDLDGFKTVNDRFGHAIGDELLAAIGTRLQELQGPGNIPVRIGGDEFVMLQSTLSHPDDADALAARILGTLGMPYVISGRPITIGISLGYTIAPSSTADLGDMMRLADAASYRVKRQGGGVDREIPATLDLNAYSSAAA
ncbi:GGDEF domain-containing protein [Rhizobium sp. C4]|uniref:GGDEF domain-containing protein n=1 Tax=Rhizobium sp. C4 TaxID=1349800 RepID=UPI001E2903A9|nr:GGDEF domain-containing protein [Rhizobium sp. C4]MCD2171884.1 GGDEF domain-containing protein [Rhizobium sp. C4]